MELDNKRGGKRLDDNQRGKNRLDEKGDARRHHTQTHNADASDVAHTKELPAGVVSS